MRRSQLWLALGVAGPFLFCGAVGLLHPSSLNDDTATLWRGIHLALIPVFPLIGLAPWLIARRVDRRLGWLGALFGYGYATFYTSLDLLAGVAAGTVQLAGIDEAKSPLYAIARILAMIGIVSLIGGIVTATIAAVLRGGLIAIPGGVIAVVGAVMHQIGHIQPGFGTASMVFLAAGFLILAYSVTRDGRTLPGWATPTGASARAAV